MTAAVRRSVIRGSGSALPERCVTNAEMATMVDTTDEWIVERTGIRNRYIAGEGETTGTLATAAARAEAAHARPPRKSKAARSRHPQRRGDLSGEPGLNGPRWGVTGRSRVVSH